MGCGCDIADQIQTDLTSIIREHQLGKVIKSELYRAESPQIFQYTIQLEKEQQCLGDIIEIIQEKLITSHHIIQQSQDQVTFQAMDTLMLSENDKVQYNIKKFIVKRGYLNIQDQYATINESTAINEFTNLVLVHCPFSYFRIIYNILTLNMSPKQHSDTHFVFSHHNGEDREILSFCRNFNLQFTIINEDALPSGSPLASRTISASGFRRELKVSDLNNSFTFNSLSDFLLSYCSMHNIQMSFAVGPTWLLKLAQKYCSFSQSLFGIQFLYGSQYACKFSVMDLLTQSADSYPEFDVLEIRRAAEIYGIYNETSILAPPTPKKHYISCCGVGGNQRIDMLQKETVRNSFLAVSGIQKNKMKEFDPEIPMELAVSKGFVD
ncbi:Hypothetical_protein [Hexamita inflata]|uniref:Hypothetical_protein n=1 Tax=Hexamita inflata TaxID=28002 RepID=A0AA86VTZ9_9EUKA|nr:Hypothetical protein HINF_LOCUS65853 [Hexamita inflata]